MREQPTGLFFFCGSISLCFDRFRHIFATGSRLVRSVHISEMDLPIDNRYNWFDAFIDFFRRRDLT